MFQQIFLRFCAKKNQASFSATRTNARKLPHIARNWIFLPFLFAAIFSLPLYLNILTYAKNIYFPHINALFALISLFIFININKKFRFFFGFFVGILWFYWIGLSFRFTEAPYFFIITIFFVALIYGLVFFVALMFSNPLFRALIFGCVGHFAILGFDWFVPDILFAFSIFQVDNFSIFLIAFVIALLSLDSIKKRAKKWRFLLLLILVFAIDFKTNEIILPNAAIKLTQTDISQDSKWKQENMNAIINENLNLIKDARERGFEIVVLPETAFPFVLNKNPFIIRELRDLSEDIDIVLGAVREENGNYYNSTFIFSDGDFNFADKVFLAPFGEYNPLPSFVLEIFSKISGIKYGEFDKTNANPKDILAKNISFRNAICYEGSVKKAYQGNPKYMILISNNAWFKPSLEPILQMTLVKYYARLHNTIVFHAANGSKSGIISPNISLDFSNKATNML